MEQWQQQNSCYICLNEDLLCCSEKVVVDLEMLELLKFLIVNVNTEALENVIVGMGCLKKIVDACEYKYKNLRVSSEILKDKMLRSDSKESIICQKCESIFHRNDASLLVDCVKHVDWLDFVNYLFENPDMEYLEKSYICNSCRISVSNIQHTLKLLYIYDQSKIQYIILNCEDTKATGNKNTAESEVTIKEEIYSDNLIKNEPVEMIPVPNDDQNNYLDYENFKLKNEEIDLKFECNDNDTDQSTHGYERVEKENEVNYPEKHDLEKEKRYNFLECGIDGITNQIKQHPVRNNVDSNQLHNYSKKNIAGEVDFKHTFGTRKLIIKLNLDANIAKKMFLMQYRLENNSQIFKCQYCLHETRRKDSLIRHIKSHQNIKEFKCTYCLKKFAQKAGLDYHLLKIHKCRDIKKKLYNCDQCSYEFLKKSQLLQHKIKHGITDNIPILKCNHCTFKTYHKSSLITHLKIHKNMKDFKCNYCSKEFIHKRHLVKHLVRIHQCKDVRKKLYNCDLCSYKCLGKYELLQHNIKHGITDGIPILKCYHCTFETYRKNSLIKHVKIHQNIKDFKCTYCLKKFTYKASLDYHLFKIHECRDIRKKLYNCDQCRYECEQKSRLLKHKIKHGITDGIPIFKCYHCTFKTYHRCNLNRHVKIHQNIKDFKCTYCLKKFTQKTSLDYHLLKIHECRDIRKKKEFICKNQLVKHLVGIHQYKNVRKKLHNCDQCSYKCLGKHDLLRHKIKHGITDGIPILKCFHCTFETYRKSSLINHVKIHPCSSDATVTVFSTRVLESE